MTKKEKHLAGSSLELRKKDTFMDRRSGEDRRQIHSLQYFKNGGQDRRIAIERRVSGERRSDYVRVSKWSSVCPDKTDLESFGGRVII